MACVFKGLEASWDKKYQLGFELKMEQYKIASSGQRKQGSVCSITISSFLEFLKNLIKALCCTICLFVTSVACLDLVA